MTALIVVSSVLVYVAGALGTMRGVYGRLRAACLDELPGSWPTWMALAWYESSFLLEEFAFRAVLGGVVWPLTLLGYGLRRWWLRGMVRSEREASHG